MNYRYGYYILRDSVYHVYDKPREHIDGLLTCKLLLRTTDKDKAISLLQSLRVPFNNTTKYKTMDKEIIEKIKKDIQLRLDKEIRDIKEADLCYEIYG